MHHPTPSDPHDLEPDDLDDLELGTPVYQGTGLTVRALSAEELDLFLDTHAQEPARRLGAGWDRLEPTPAAPARGSPAPAGPVGVGWPAPVLADPARAPRGGYGTPGRSALAMYRRERARELAAWARTLPWRAAVVLAVAAGATIVAAAAGLRSQALAAGLAAGVVVGWRLRFRPSRDTRAWRDGVRGERATARPLRRLARQGFTVFHDVAIPGTPANADHVVIGPAGVVLVDSKRYTGRVWQGPGGRVWHDQYPIDRPLRSLRLETAAISRALGVPVRPVVCVHRAHVDLAGLGAGDIDILPAGRLAGVLTAAEQRLSSADVAALVARAHTMLRPA
jgi:Nuclease-related domain